MSKLKMVYYFYYILNKILESKHHGKMISFYLYRGEMMIKTPCLIFRTNVYWQNRSHLGLYLPSQTFRMKIGGSVEDYSNLLI